MTHDLTCRHERVFGPIAMVGMCLSIAAAISVSTSAHAAGPLASLPVAQAASAVPTDVRARPVYGPLQAGQMAQIQNLGRSVLIAQHSQQPSAQEQALVDEVHALSGEINQVIMPHDSNVALSVADESSSKTTFQSSTQVPSKSESLRNALQPHLTRLHERGAALESVKPVESDAREAHLERARHLNRQVAEIEHAVQAAMALPDNERHVKLVELSKQLTPRTQGQWLHDERLKEEAEHPSDAASAASRDQATPTVTTLIAHRPWPTEQTRQSSRASNAASAAPANLRPALMSRPVGKRPTQK